MILQLGVRNLIGCDSKGAIHTKRNDLNSSKRWFADSTNRNQDSGTLKDVIAGADVFVGVSAPNVINQEDVKCMAKDPIVFAMSNPDPEISPDEALPVVAVMATGRSDYQNQINNIHNRENFIYFCFRIKRYTCFFTKFFYFINRFN